MHMHIYIIYTHMHTHLAKLQSNVYCLSIIHLLCDSSQMVALAYSYWLVNFMIDNNIKASDNLKFGFN